MFILVCTIAPIYWAMTRQAQSAEDTEKLQMAERILTSIKEELQATDYLKFVKYAKENPPDGQKKYNLEDGFYPTSLDKILAFQKKYRDFRISGQFFFILRGGQEDKTMLQVNLKCNWRQPDGEKERTTSLLLMAPR